MQMGVPGNLVYANSKSWQNVLEGVHRHKRWYLQEQLYETLITSIRQYMHVLIDPIIRKSKLMQQK